MTGTADHPPQRPTGRPAGASVVPLRIMVIDENPVRGEMLGRALAASGYHLVGRVLAGDFLPVRVAEAKPDVILIDTTSPSRDTLEQLGKLNAADPRPVVMFSGDDDRATIQAAVTAGVSAYVVDGLANQRIQPVIEVAIAQFGQHQRLRTELDKTRGDLADRKDVERAKGLIMRQRQCDEPAAHAVLRKLAMDRKQRLGDAARDLIQMLDSIGEAPGENHKR